MIRYIGKYSLKRFGSHLGPYPTSKHLRQNFFAKIVNGFTKIKNDRFLVQWKALDSSKWFSVTFKCFCKDRELNKIYKKTINLEGIFVVFFLNSKYFIRAKN